MCHRSKINPPARNEPGEGTLRRVFVTENDFRADGAAAHAGLPVFALGTASPEMLSELLKDRTVPGLLNGVVSQVHRPPLMLVIEAAWKHFHIGGDVS